MTAAPGNLPTLGSIETQVGPDGTPQFPKPITRALAAIEVWAAAASHDFGAATQQPSSFALMDGNGGKFWQCTQFDLTEAGAFLMCDLVDRVGGNPVLLTLAECTAAEPTGTEAGWIN